MKWGIIVRFEYDSAKSAKNEEKHGIDFETAQELWWGEVDTVLLCHKGERRYLSVGRIAGEYWAVIHTRRGDATRIISARLATKEERSRYDRVYNG